MVNQNVKQNENGKQNVKQNRYCNLRMQCIIRNFRQGKLITGLYHVGRKSKHKMRILILMVFICSHTRS